ncbi:hypothetical protein FRB95_011841 [Tulasnella sp. JGI-2019a]|nr:hypothetical protein FRB95_011841 [Tulasnella sp. JGI-2019a]
MLPYLSTTIALAFLIVTAVQPHPFTSNGHDEHVKPGSLLSRGGSNWYHDYDHHSLSLFKRLAPKNGSAPAVGSDERNNMYPGYGVPDPTQMPTLWKEALQKAEAANLIPDIQPSTGEGVYTDGVNAGGPEICSSASQCRAPGDIWDAPDGMLGIAFDDGPTTASSALYTFLKAQGQLATHFYIGVNVLGLPDTFMTAFNQLHDIACHTWSHPYMSTLTNAEIVAELGWAQQITSDLTGGRVPKFWRPPYGDSDNRVRAIAHHIFGLTQVNWNQDSEDWEMAEGLTTAAKVNTSMVKFIDMPKSPGLMILEHELDPNTVKAFVQAYPLMKSKGWDTRSIPELFGLPYYQNAQDDQSTVSEMDIIANATVVIGLSLSTTIPPEASQVTSATSSTTSSASTSAACDVNCQASKTSAAVQNGVNLGRYFLAFIFLAYHLFVV